MSTSSPSVVAATPPLTIVITQTVKPIPCTITSWAVLHPATRICFTFSSAGRGPPKLRPNCISIRPIRAPHLVIGHLPRHWCIPAIFPGWIIPILHSIAICFSLGIIICHPPTCLTWPTASRGVIPPRTQCRGGCGWWWWWWWYWFSTITTTTTTPSPA